MPRFDPSEFADDNFSTLKDHTHASWQSECGRTLISDPTPLPVDSLAVCFVNRVRLTLAR